MSLATEQPSGARVSHLRALEAAESGLAAAPDDATLLFERAVLLVELGRGDEAVTAYMAVLARDPSHPGALNNLGTLLYETGRRTAARTAYAEAVARHPDAPMGHINLANLLLGEGEVSAARWHFETALRLDTSAADAHRGLAYCLDEAGEPEAAARHRDLAFRGRALRNLPYRGDGTPVRLLMLVAGRGGNIPTRTLLDDRIFATSVLVADYFDPGASLPAHDLVFNAIGDADLCGDALLAAARLVAGGSAPVVNPPARVIGTGRAEVARRLADIPGLRAPRVRIYSRDALSGAGAAARLQADGFAYPLLLRAPGFHTGRHFLRVEGAQELGGAVASIPGRDIAAIEFLDARGGDGLARKYRAMMLGGRLYPIHLAAAGQWKVHYFTSAMAESQAHRAEEAVYLNDMRAVLGARAMSALELVANRLGLDYGGVDFGLAADGNLLLFEANATMVINPPEPDPIWDYRRPAVGRALDAVREMLISRAGGRLPAPRGGS